MTTNRFGVSSLAVASLLPLAMGSAYAQEDDDEILEVIVITGVRASIVNALDNKANETRVTDSIQAEDLGEFPDINLAESLQRIPGVTLERAANGASRTLTVRGLSSQFTRVEVNGMGGATGGGGRAGRIDASTRGFGNDGRGFNFDVLPSELFTSAVVAKSPQAQDTEGGIAALVELTTPSPFDVGDNSGMVALQGNWGEVSGAAPRLSGIYSKQLSDEFGFLAGAVYSQNTSSTTTVGYMGFETLESLAGNPGDFTATELSALTPEGVRHFFRERETDNLSFLATLEWRPEFGHVRFDAFHSVTDGTEQEVQIAYSANNATISNVGIRNGVVTSGDFEFGSSELEYQSDNPDDTVQQFTLDADIELGDLADGTWTVNPFLGYNKRETDRPYHQLDFFGAGGTLALDGSGAVDGFSLVDAPSVNEDASAYRIGNVFSAGNQNDSDQFDIELNFRGEFGDGMLDTVHLGLRHSQRSSSVDEPFFGQLNFGGVPTLADAPGLGRADLDFDTGNRSIPNSVFFIDVSNAATFFLGGQNILNQDSFDLGQSLLDAPFLIGSETSNELARSSVDEETVAAYIGADATLGSFDVNVGIRAVKTEVAATGGQVVNGSPTIISISEDYSEILPALNAKYHFTDVLFLRGAYSRALSRPSLAALAPRETIAFDPLNPTNSGGSRGNPGLSPFVVDQFDVGVEWYFHEEGLLAFTYFEKDFSSLIASEEVQVLRVLPDENGQPTEYLLDFTQPFNSGEGEVKGFEITAQSSLYFLGETFDDFGILLNYTDLESKAAIANEDGNQLQPFPNLSPSSLNAGIYFDNGTVSARIDYAWREGFLVDALNPAGDFPFQEDFGQLDATLNYSLRDNINLQFQATNLLDDSLKFSNSQTGTPLREINLERRLLVGIRYEF